MGLADIADKIHADAKRVVMHQTWGHLFPEDTETFGGTIQMVASVYGDTVVLKDTTGVPDSPWYYESLMTFVSEFLTDKEDGVVYDVEVICSVAIDEDNGREIDIRKIGEKVVLK